MNKKEQRLKRKKRVKNKIYGTDKRPRLSVFRSSRYIYAQLISDETEKTILGISEKEFKKEEIKGLNKTEKAKKLGLILARKAIEKKIKKIIFDKGSYSYHGRVKAIADGVREGGLNL